MRVKGPITFQTPFSLMMFCSSLRCLKTARLMRELCHVTRDMVYDKFEGTQKVHPSRIKRHLVVETGVLVRIRIEHQKL